MTKSSVISLNISLNTIIGGLFLASLLFSCSSSQKKEDHQLKAAVLSQIKSSVEDEQMVYIKSVKDLSGENSVIEDSSLHAKDHDLNAIITRDLDYAFNVYHQNPLYEDLLSFKTSNDTLIAELIPGNERKIDLHHQKVLWNADQTQVQFLESKVKKNNWLYTLEVSIKVEFDSLGNYTDHYMELTSSVPIIGSGIEANINGKLEKP